jgi:hypothetical protein
MPHIRNWLCFGVLILGSCLAACASNAPVNGSAARASQDTRTVQCTTTNDPGGTPCIEQARQACGSDHVQLQQIESKNVIPATQGVAQAPMPITQYVVTYVCDH